MSNIIILAAIILYLGMVVWIGVICSKKNSDVGDFYLGGRKLGPVVTAMSAEASDMSSYLLMGVPGLAYLTGLADATWTAIGLALGTYLNWLIVAKKIRLYSHGYQAITLPDYFSKRFGDDKHVITLISAALIVIFFIPYTASGFAACGKLFNSLLGFDYHAAMIVSAVVIVLYCTMGGFLAASTSDLVQSIIMTFALAVVVIFGIVQALNHPNKNIITRAVGVDKNIEIDFDQIDLDDDTTLLLCTDGLSNYVSDSEILELTSDKKHYAFADRLVNKANENGGGDNITVVVISK